MGDLRYIGDEHIFNRFGNSAKLNLSYEELPIWNNSNIPQDKYFYIAARIKLHFKKQFINLPKIENIL